MSIVLKRKKKQVSLDPDLVSLLRFNGNLYDEITGDEMSTAGGEAAYTTDKNGKANSAFDTVNSAYLIRENIQSIQGLNSMTLGGWFYVDSSNAVPNTRGGILQNSPDNTDRLFFLYPHTAVRFYLFNENQQFFFLETPSVVEMWFHIAAVYTGSQVKLYRNAILKASVPANGTLPNKASDYVINNTAYRDDNESFFHYDDIFLHKRALTEEEILNVYENGF